MPDFVKVATVDEIPLGKMKSCEAKHSRVVVCHMSDGFYALADECTHDGAPISTGRVRGEEVVCPRHGAKFDVRTGAVTAPPAIVGIDTFEVKVEGNDIFVLLD